MNIEELIGLFGDDGIPEELIDEFTKIKIKAEKMEKKLSKLFTADDTEDDNEDIISEDDEEEMRRKYQSLVEIEQFEDAVEHNDIEKIKFLLTNIDPSYDDSSIVIFAAYNNVNSTTMEVLLNDNRIDGRIGDNVLVNIYLKDKNKEMLKVLYNNVNIKESLDKEMKQKILNLINF